VVSEKQFDFNGTLSVDVMDFSGISIFSQKLTNVLIKDNESKIVFTVKKSDLGDADLTKTLIKVRFDYEFDEKSSDNVFYFVRPINFTLEEPNLDITFNKEHKSITIKTDKLAKDVYVYA
jgi:hypothetical protein